MPATRDLRPGVTLIRPMLTVSRADVQARADAHGWAWQEDSTNAERAYRRNRLRADVMSWLRDESGADVDLRIAASADAARAALGLVRDRLVSLAVEPGRLSVPGLREMAPEVRRLGDCGSDRSGGAGSRPVVRHDSVASWAWWTPRSGRRSRAAGCDVWRERDVLRIDTGSQDVYGGTLVVTPLDAVPETFDTGPEAEVVDVDRAAGEVEVRTWTEGDRIVPLGLDRLPAGVRPAPRARGAPCGSLACADRRGRRGGRLGRGAPVGGRRRRSGRDPARGEMDVAPHRGGGVASGTPPQSPCPRSMVKAIWQ